MELWMYWITAIIFTGVGYYFGINQPITFSESKRITQQTIDTLIEMGYIKTIKSGKDTEMVKWEQEEDL